MKQSDTLLVEFWDGGHRCYYLEAALRGGFPGRLLVSPEVHERLSPEVRSLAIGRIEIVQGTRNSHWAQVQAIRNHQLSCRRAERVVCMFLDDLLVPLSTWAMLPGVRKWLRGLGGILFGNRAFYHAATERRSRLSLRLQTFMLRRLVSQSVTGQLLLHDDHWLAYLAAQGLARHQLAIVPDPIIPAPVLRREAGHRPSRQKFTVGFFGEHAPRKGTVWALQALADSGSPWRALVAGTCHADPGLPEFCRSFGGQLEVDIRLGPQQLPAAEFIAAMAEADVIALPYSDFYGSSGILGHAMQLGRPVVASDIGVIARRVNEVGIGACYRTGDQRDFIAKLEWVRSQSADRSQVSSVRTYLEGVTPERFAEVL